MKTIDPISNQRNISYINQVIMNLGHNLGLIEVELPMFIEKGSEYNDGLNGEQPVSFVCTGNDKEYEIVHSHAKLKRNYLSKYREHFTNRFDGASLSPNGIVSRMNAIRAFETQDLTHHFNVRQLDMCLIAPVNDGNNDISDVIRKFAHGVVDALDIPNLGKIHFIESKEVPRADNLDDITRKREAFELECGEQYGVFVILGIGNGNKCGTTLDGHEYAYDHRAPDYDDHKFNGDILIYHPKLQRSIEICSFGYRVDKNSLAYQMGLDGKELSGTYHDDIMNDRLVQTIGGGLGVDRLLMVKLGEMSVHNTNPN